MATVQISCGIGDYAVYEERIKVSPTQFVAQIGGDLGIYIGLSAFGIWQLLISVFHQYKKRKEEAVKNAQKRVSSTRIARKTIISALVGYTGDEKNTENLETTRESEAGALLGKDELRQRLENLEEKLASVDEKMKEFIGIVSRMKLTEGDVSTDQVQS